MQAVRLGIAVLTFLAAPLAWSAVGVTVTPNATSTGLPLWIAGGALAATPDPAPESCIFCLGFGFFTGAGTEDAVYQRIATLPTKPSGDLRFSVLTPAESKALGLTDRERMAYGRHLGALNATTARIGRDFQDAVRGGHQPTVEFASLLWIRHAEQIDSPETVAAARKILARYVEDCLAVPPS